METRWNSEVIIIIVCSFAKQLVKCPLGFLQSLVRADASWQVALREVEVFTEVRPFFLSPARLAARGIGTPQRGRGKRN